MNAPYRLPDEFETDRYHLRQVKLDDAQAIAPPDARGRAVLWLPWAGIAGFRSVPDPYYGGDVDFEHSWALLEAAAQATVQRLAVAAESGIIGS